MCGIAGGVALTADATLDSDRVYRMAGLLAHRGPDAQGFWSADDGRAALAHRRLSVIDLEGGAQPMVDGSSPVAIVFNGEIYNYRETREALRREGVTFRTESDTEVLLQLYQRYGTGCLEYLRGMFAFAIWDGRRRRLFIARDRMGKKPLFYQLVDGCFYFASTLKALKDTSPRARSINLEAVDAFLHLGYIPAPLTIYSDLSKLQAGTMLNIAGARVHETRYWHPGALPSGDAEPPRDFEAALDRADELLNTAVALRLRSDVPLGVFLSGGIDSTLITAIAARQVGKGLRSFSIGFTEAAWDESAQAERIARALGTTHRTITGTGDLLSTLPAMVRHFGEPFGDATALAMYLLAQRTREDVTVALSGDGGDEAFAGYSWYRTARRLRRAGAIVPRAVAAVGRDMVTTGRVHRGLTLLAQTDADRWGALRTFLTSAERDELYAGELARHDFAAGDWLADLYEQSAGSALRQMRVADLQSYLADCLMPKVDVPTMAFGLEARAPLLDQEIVAFALALPDAWLEHPHGGKRLLRALLGRYISPSLIVGRKRGFTLPLDTWLPRDMLPGQEVLRETGWFHDGPIAHMLYEHRAGTRDHTQRLYNLIVLAEWLKS